MEVARLCVCAMHWLPLCARKECESVRESDTEKESERERERKRES